jgi:hypothetical protein
MDNKYICGCVNDFKEALNDLAVFMETRKNHPVMVMLGLCMLCRKHQVEACDIILDRQQFILKGKSHD